MTSSYFLQKGFNMALGYFVPRDDVNKTQRLSRSTEKSAVSRLKSDAHLRTGQAQLNFDMF